MGPKNSLVLRHLIDEFLRLTLNLDQLILHYHQPVGIVQLYRSTYSHAVKPREGTNRRSR